jgi:glycosyltransferase involved in cell wall biosynthesis
MKNILGFGHLPIENGGRQSSGLASVMFKLYENINLVDDFSYWFVATDISKSEKNIIGWSIKAIIKYALSRPWVIFYYFIKSLKLNFLYNTPFFNTYIKLLLYDKSIYQFNPEIVHLHGCSSVIFYELYNFNKLKVVITIHGINGYDDKISGYKFLRKMEFNLSLRINTHLVFVCEDLKKSWLSNYPKQNIKSSVILNAYDKNVFFYDRKSFNSNNIIRLTTIGSLSERKGQIRVIEALSLIKNQKIEYTTIGTGSKKFINTLNSIASEKRINYTHYGHLSPKEIKVKLNETDFMILPSSSEGFGLVYLEALACGVPIILPQYLPIVKESFINQNNAILLNDSSSESIKHVIENITKYKFDFKNVAKTVNHLSWENIGVEYANLFNNIINE